MGTGRLIAVLALLACAAAVPVDAAGPKTHYERVLAQEQTLRLQSRRPAPLSHIRKVVSAYEYVARRHPTSGYADNALMQAAELSLTAHRIYGSSMDRDAAARMLQWLVDQYPHSSLITKARQLLRKAKAPERPAERPMTVARATATMTTPPPASLSMRIAPAATTVMTPTVVPNPSASNTTRTGTTSAGTTNTGAMNSGSMSTGRTFTPTLKQVTRTELADMVRVTLEFDGAVEYKQERLDGPARLYFDLKNTQAVPPLQDAVFSYADEAVRHIRLGRPKQDTTRLVIDLAGVENYVVFSLPNPYRLMVDLQRRTPHVPTIVARAASPPVAGAAPKLVSASVPRDLDLLRRIPPRPLPHPLADAPRVTSSRRVSAELAAMTRLRPLRTNRINVPMSAPLASVTALHSAPVAADVARLFIVAPLTASRRGIPLNTTAPRAPRSTNVAARMRPEELPSRPSGPSTLPAPTAPSTNSAGGFSLARQLGLGVARIVIDPGHGGHDPGNLGSKVSESDVVLDVALRLEKLLLNEPGFEVVMTRRTDVFIPLEERPAIANRHQADLFLSIHANASRNKQASGVETYYLNFATNPEAEALAARENAGAAQTMNHLPEIVKAIAMNNKLDESRDFAHVVQDAMVDRLKVQNAIMRDRGVKQAPFVVLIGAGMPSVLAEIAFLSHQQEAGLMRTGNYRQKVAEALFEAVKSYQRSLKAVGTVAAQVDTNDRN